MKEFLPEGKCALCNVEGKIHYHHLIPKRYRIKTKVNATLFYMCPQNKQIKKLGAHVEHLCISVCDSCHKKLHPENWKYTLNEHILKANKNGHPGLIYQCFLCGKYHRWIWQSKECCSDYFSQKEIILNFKFDKI